MAEQDVLDKLADVLEKVNEVKEILETPQSVQTICRHCGGDGQKGTVTGSISCPDCGGDGVLTFARITNTSDE